MHKLSIVIIICGLILRLILATINVEYGIFTNAVPDSLKFHEEGLKFLNYLKIFFIYQKIWDTTKLMNIICQIKICKGRLKFILIIYIIQIKHKRNRLNTLAWSLKKKKST